MGYIPRLHTFTVYCHVHGTKAPRIFVESPCTIQIHVLVLPFVDKQMLRPVPHELDPSVARWDLDVSHTAAGKIDASFTVLNPSSVRSCYLQFYSPAKLMRIFEYFKINQRTATAWKYSASIALQGEQKEKQCNKYTPSIGIFSLLSRLFPVATTVPSCGEGNFGFWQMRLTVSALLFNSDCMPSHVIVLLLELYWTKTDICCLDLTMSPLTICSVFSHVACAKPACHTSDKGFHPALPRLYFQQEIIRFALQ